MKSNNHKLYGIQYLRGVAAILVVLWHTWWVIGPEWRDIIKYSFIGVDIFFVISGFIIYTVTQRPSETTAKPFALKRFFRIYPAFFVVWFIVMATCFSNATFYDSVRSLLLIHIDYRAPAPGFNYNKIGPAWTLTYEIYFYIIFMISFMISHKYRGLISSTFIILLPIILQLSFNGGFVIRSNASAHVGSNSIYYAPIAVLSCTMMWEFVVGIAIAYLWSRLSSNVNKAGNVYVYLFSGLLLAGFVYGTFGDVKLVQGITGFIFPATCAFLSFLLIGLRLPLIKPLNYLGDISYSIYLVHWAVVKMIPLYVPGKWSILPKPYNLLAYLIVVIIISTALHYLVEKPSIKICRRILSNKSTEKEKLIPV